VREITLSGGHGCGKYSESVENISDGDLEAQGDASELERFKRPTARPETCLIGFYILMSLHESLIATFKIPNIHSFVRINFGCSVNSLDIQSAYLFFVSMRSHELCCGNRIVLVLRWYVSFS
jgi:hypothetical protein